MGCSIIHVVQDAAAVIRNETPQNIQYLYTNGLGSCIAIMAKGADGIALLHDGGKLTEDSIADIFRGIGEIQFWTTAFNPNADREYEKLYSQIYAEKYGSKGIYPTKFERIQLIMTRVLDSEVRSKYQPQWGGYYKAGERMVCFDREGKVYTMEKEALFLENYFPGPDFDLRQSICNLNNSLLYPNPFECHIQFDGNRFIAHPALALNITQIEELAKKDGVIVQMLQAYTANKTRFEQYQTILKMELNLIRQKYTSDNKEIVSVENALRKAAEEGNIEHIRFLIEKAGVNVNSQGPQTGKTALHRAVEKGHQVAVEVLLGYGASKEILDNNGNPPNCK